jgi:ribose transport system substrate-binding protein
MKKNRTLLRFLVLLSILLLQGCTSGQKKLKIVLVPKSISNPYWFQVKDGMESAMKELNIDCEFNGPVQAADVAKQVEIMESLIFRRVDGIAVSPNDPEGISSVIDQAMQAGIPVITFDSDAPHSKRICYIGTDNYQAGCEAARQMVRFTGSAGAYAIMTGGLGALNLNERIRGFRDELKSTGAQLQEMNMLACDDDTDRALMQMEDVTRSVPALTGWFVTGCWPTVAPREAFLNSINRRTDLVIIGFDTVQEQLELVKEGLVQALIGQRPYLMGQKSVETLYDILKNKMPDRVIINTGVDVVTTENVDSFFGKTKKNI